MNKSKLLFLTGIAISTSFAFGQVKLLKPERPNVLFIAVDDLRPELGCYGKAHIKSPNIDRLAMSGVIFNNAFANYPVCGPSRASLLSGIYPGSKRFVIWNCSQDKDVPGIVSLPMHFRNNNYQTVSLGKVYNNFEDGKGSWVKNWRPAETTTNWDYQSEEGIRTFEERNKEWYKDQRIRDNNNLPQRGPAYESPDVPDIAYEDGRIASRAIEELQHFQDSREPFFLAVGFKKPHLPFNAPKKYWNMYDKKDIQLPSNYFFPRDAPDAARLNWNELRFFAGMPSAGPLPDTTAINLIHGYYACVSYVDAQIGLVLNALETLGLAQNTIVILWGDHGWFLGEHGFWTKQSNLEKGPHAPLIVKVPWKSGGLKTGALVEFVDIYPTLCELAGLSAPVHLQGKSFAPLLDNPDQPWKESIFYRAGTGETILTTTHGYTEWINPGTGQPSARMLYDHRVDPEENVNIADRPEHKKLIKSLQEQLHQHIKTRDNFFIP
ncbi:sulfatase [Agriterribacter sp.]|uniref:sulfatase n=1 Tax=Agriterribacter sp. TaxID=2821509 RepID=UPI002CB37B9D|nr:sulfatase [Agriterribacter sp.]HRO47152.1 sulfatase [Agriterribacter sp.]HRQ17898.1 sulfatase [Agriterribacter sp.]